MGHLYKNAGEISDAKCCEEVKRVSGVVLQLGKEGACIVLHSLLLLEIICYLNEENVPQLCTVDERRGHHSNTKY